MLGPCFHWASIANALTLQKRHGGSSTWYCLQSLHTVTEELSLAFFSFHPSHSFMCVNKTKQKKKNKAAEEVNNVCRTIITGPLKTWTSEKGNTFLHVLWWRTHNYLEIPFNHVQILLLKDLKGLIWMWISCENLESQKTRHPHTSAEREQPVLQDLSCICSCIHQVQFSDYTNSAQTWKNIITYIFAV